MHKINNNMSAWDPNRKESWDTETIDYRKLLWGIRQNRDKLEKMVEQTLSHIEKALDLAEKAQEMRMEEGKKPLVQKDKEILLLKNEREVLETTLENIVKCRNKWPKARRRRAVDGASPPSKPRAHPLILVIDDERITARSLEHFLSQKGFAVVSCGSAEEGLNQAFSLGPDLILLDIMMPGMNGYQFLARLKNEKDTESIPVIVLSTLSRESDILEGLEKGAVDYIVKPYSPQILLSKVTKILAV